MQGKLRPAVVHRIHSHCKKLVEFEQINVNDTLDSL